MLSKFDKMLFQVIGAGVFLYGLIHSILLYFIDSDIELWFYNIFGKSPSCLKGQVVFITGASSGIGEHTAIALAKHGVKLVLTARRKIELDRVKRICLEVSKGKLHDRDILVIPMDMMDINSHQDYFEQAVQHFGHVNILFNNAGRSQRAMWEEIDMAVDKEMFELNVFSVINLTRVAVKYFNDRGKGHVAATSSIAGVLGVPFSGTYCGSKFALHGYYNTLRNEKGHKNLCVTLLCPGPTFTNFLTESFTGKPGEKYGIGTRPTDKRMTAERCGELCAVALANKIPESWIALFPLIPLVYIAVYFPFVFRCGLKILGPEALFKLRDSRDTSVLNEVHTV
ncbi:dehydrogenase/reductase sdr family member 7-related [Holotrichia oblita]|uniref:Dehydrogenase/reductase sdr family member 7-related n=1 Tax=Holotrichia oblita TaxID=644536 RepID=A0ACB9TY14_HOLOL|nr:dehydrogenase/reductase sdr family member 7-related [Holotrichia oblita]